MPSLLASRWGELTTNSCRLRRGQRSTERCPGQFPGGQGNGHGLPIKHGHFNQQNYKVVPQFGIAKLVQITPITMVSGKYNELVTGVYKPTFTSLGGTILY